MPTRIRVFWNRLVTPSVTSWSSASTSFVSRLMRTPARLRSKKPSESRCRWRKRRVAEVGEDPLAGPAREVGLRRAREPVQDSGDDERDDDDDERR